MNTRMNVKPLALLKTIFLTGLFLIPFVFWPWAKIPYEIPRVWFFCRWVEILGLFSLFLIPRLSQKKKFDAILFWLLVLWGLWSLISSLGGVDFAKSYWGNYWRADGLDTLFHLMAFSLFLFLFWEKTWWKQAAMTVSLSGLGVSLWSLFSHLKILSNSPSVSFGHVNFLSGYLLMVLPITLFLTSDSLSKKAKYFWIFSLAIQVLAIAATSSRGGILGIIFFFLGWFMLFKINVSANRFFVLFTVLATVFSIFWYKQETVFTFESRERIMTRGLLAFRERPIFGWGVANFGDAFNAIDWPMKYDQDITADKAHSTFLEILVTTGTVGFLFYLGVLSKLYINITKATKINKYLFLIFLLYLFHSQTTIISLSEEVFFWLIIGISANS